MRKIIKQILFIGNIFAFLLALNGCGQKGPLYLPHKSQPQTNNKTNHSWYVGGSVGVNGN